MRALALALVGIVACASTTAPPRRESSLQVPEMSAASAKASPNVGNGPKQLVLQSDVPDAKGWTDPEVVNRLAVDCHWRPINPKDNDFQFARNTLSCHIPLNPSSLPFPCDADKQECKTSCSADCNRCTGGCTTQCDSCKSSCTDEGCLHSCAEQCATCRAGCVHSADQCDSNVCELRATICEKEDAELLGKPTCKAACAAAPRCRSNCGNVPRADCVQTCIRKLADACNERLFAYCIRAGR